jgi:HlyD family secretion protein
MTGKKFFIFLFVVFLISLTVYLLTTPRGSYISLTGVVDGTEVIVSPQITGRMIHLYVDEGAEVKKGQLLAELDPTELQAALAQDEANIGSLDAKTRVSQQTVGWTQDQTNAALGQAKATLTASRAQLEQARANLELDEITEKRTLSLFQSGVDSAADRDAAESSLKAQEANVHSLEEQVKAQQAALAVAEANRLQVGVQQADLASAKAQVEQAKALRDQASTQLGYTKIYSPLDGVVSVRVARQGEVVAQGSPIVVIVDVDHLWVRADVEESYIDSIQFGQEMKVRLPSGKMLEGQVFFKGVESDYATQRDVSRTKRDIKTFAIKVGVPNASRDLFTGMTAYVLMPSPSHKHWFAKS